MDGNGTIQNDAEGIANALADFYETLHRAVSDVVPGYGSSTDTLRECRPVTRKEVSKQLDKMKVGKTADSSCTVAEFFKFAGDEMKDLLADLFSDILAGKGRVPQYWKGVTIQVLFKKGERHLPSHYRPISIIPIISKLFSRILLARLDLKLQENQSCDQAGFRADFSCEDHLLTITLLAEVMMERQQPLWVAALDFQKAFDTISHQAVRKALGKQQIEAVYIQVLQEMYSDQTARISTCEKSRSFEIKRGVKQGDPISPALFNAVVEQVMRKLQPKWRAKGYGISLQTGQRETLTNLRFADTILLIGMSLKQVSEMLTDIAKATGEVGLGLHMGKAKLLSNGIGRMTTSRKVTVLNKEVEVLPPWKATAYLGKDLCLSNVHDAEIESRVRKAWAKFNKFKSELCDTAFSLNLRLRLFNAVVTQTVMYGSAA